MGQAWDAVRPATGMITLARAARQAGCAVALLSNSFGLDPYDPYRQLGVWDLFDVTVITVHADGGDTTPAHLARLLGLPAALS